MRLRALGWSATVLLGAYFATPAEAQAPFDEVERTSRQLPFEQRSPFGGLAEVGSLSRHWSVNTFYTVFRGEYPSQTRFWVIRRVSGALDRTDPVQWADSRACPAVERALIAMERLPAVKPDAPQIGEEADTLGIVLDGTHHIFWNRWARSGGDDATVGLEITGNVNAPIARWWSAAAADLAPCWRETKPS
jgi:hypothetical protein